MCRKSCINSNWFHKHRSDLSLVRWAAQRLDLHLIEPLWNETEGGAHSRNVLKRNLRDEHDAMESARTKIPKEYLQHLVECMPLLCWPYMIH